LRSYHTRSPLLNVFADIQPRSGECSAPLVKLSNDSILGEKCCSLVVGIVS